MTLRLALALPLALLLASAGPQAAQAAKIVDLGTFIPVAINASHQIVGYTSDGAAALWQRGVVTPLSPLPGGSLGGGRYIETAGINNAGRVAGTSPAAGGAFHAAYWDQPGAARDVGVLDSTNGGYSKATGINKNGDIVGESIVSRDPSSGCCRRAFVAINGGGPVQVGTADTPAGGTSTGWGIDDGGRIFGIAGSGTSFQRYVWPGASGSGTTTDMWVTAKHPVSPDGSIVGGHDVDDSNSWLRDPATGIETSLNVTGAFEAQAVNTRHEVVGLGTGGATMWQSGVLTNLNTKLPVGSPWTLSNALDVTANGDVIGFGAMNGQTHGYLLLAGITVNDASDTRDAVPGDGACADASGKCTLRAAIQEVNAERPTAAEAVKFDIPDVPAGQLPHISPASPLPTITAPVSIDGSTQSGALVAGTRKIGAIVDGTTAGADATGLDLAAGARAATVAGLQLQHFGGDGVRLGGDDQQVADSVLTSDRVGVEVAGTNDLVGAGNGLVGDIFFADGDLNALVQYEKGLSGRTAAPAAYQAAQAAAGGGVLLTQPSSGAKVLGDFIGVHGPGFTFTEADRLPADGFRATDPADPADRTVSTFGVLVAPSSGQVSDVTIGGPGAAANVVSGDLFGVLALANAAGTIDGLSVQGSAFGPHTDGTSADHVGDLVGVAAQGRVSGLQIGTPAAGNSFQGDVAGVLLKGAGLSSPRVQNNKIGVDANLGDLVAGAELGLGYHDVFGVMAADTHGAAIDGNQILGDVVGVILGGQQLQGNTISNNVIGSAVPPGFTSFRDVDPKALSGIVGTLYTGYGQPGQVGAGQGTTVAGNTVQGEVIGLMSDFTTGMQLHGNTIRSNVFGLFDVGSGGALIGGSGAGQGNAVLRNAIGLVLANVDPTPTELQAGEVKPGTVSQDERRQALSMPDENLVFNDVNATTTAALSSTSADTSSAPGTGNAILGNRIGVDSAGNSQPNTLPMIVVGDEHGVKIGGTGPGEGNAITDNRAAGLWLLGTGRSNPTAQVLGNTIYDNENFTGSITGTPGLGIDLASDRAGFGLGVNSQDATQPDSGPNNNQNAPLLTGASTSSGQVTVSGTLAGVPGTSYVLEVFADQFKNPFGAGEGQTLLGRVNVSTDASGNASFSASYATPPGAAYVSATATTVPASGLGVTSEFALDVPITAAPTSPPGSAPPSGGGGGNGSGATPGRASITGSNATVSHDAAAVRITCSSAGPCRGSDEIAAFGAQAAGRRTKRPRRAIVARGHYSIAARKTATVRIPLTPTGKRLLKRHHGTLRTTLKLTPTRGKQVTRSLTLRQAKPRRHKKR